MANSRTRDPSRQRCCSSFLISGSRRSGRIGRSMSVAEQTAVVEKMPSRKHPPRRNGRWAGYRHLLMARMLELKREPEVVFWVFVFPLLLATGLGIAFRNKPADASSVAIVSGTGSEQAQALLARSPQHEMFKIQVLDTEDARKGFRLGKFDLVIEPDGK